jgi:hypothetical protein
VPVQVQTLDLYKHFGAFSLVWVPSMDLYERLLPDVVIVQISFVQEIARRTVLVKPLTSEFPHEPFLIDNEPDMGSLCDAAGLVLGRYLKGEFLAIDLG